MRLAENTVTTAVLSADLTAATDKLQFAVFAPIRIERYGLVADGAAPIQGGSGILTLNTVNLEAGANTVTPRQTMNITDGPEGTLQYATLEQNAPAPGSDAPTGRGNSFIIPGMDYNEVPGGYEVTIEVSVVATAGDAHIFLEYTQLTFANQFNLDESDPHFPVDNGVVPAAAA